MRFIRINKNGSLSLTKHFYGDEIPGQYAILSHTWGDDEDEVSYQDFQRQQERLKAGYSKIAFCARQAQQDAIRYFWIDTCCIDQSNHVEVSEAINSMFRWYHNAARCYVLLTDVTHSNPTGPMESSQIHHLLRKSRWFTRGWTLQELIAPKILIFYDRNGRSLGTKFEVHEHITAITGIPQGALAGAPLKTWTVGERFSWSKGRNTKRPEDLAYCLLGIFDVCMPLLYGEGTDHALARLYGEVLKLPEREKLVDEVFALLQPKPRLERTVSFPLEWKWTCVKLAIIVAILLWFIQRILVAGTYSDSVFWSRGSEQAEYC